MHSEQEEEVDDDNDNDDDDDDDDGMMSIVSDKAVTSTTGVITVIEI